MKLSLALRLTLPCLMALTLSAGAQAPPTLEASRSSLTAGVEQFKAGNYQQAAIDFQAAAAEDPTSVLPHLYLGIAYAYQVVPGDSTQPNIDLAHKAIEQLRQVPATHSGYLNALRQIASVERNIKEYDDARETELKIEALAPDDPQAFYTVGVIDWTIAYRTAAKELAAQGLTDDGMGNRRMSPATCAEIQEQNRAAIDESIAQLKKAIELRPNYDDAMQYLNLVYRRHADFACGDDAARKQDLASADEWVQRAIAIRKQRTMHPGAQPQ